MNVEECLSCSKLDRQILSLIHCIVSHGRDILLLVGGVDFVISHVRMHGVTFVSRPVHLTRNMVKNIS